MPHTNERLNFESVEFMNNKKCLVACKKIMKTKKPIQANIRHSHNVLNEIKCPLIFSGKSKYSLPELKK